MKSIILSFIICFALTAPLYAQDFSGGMSPSEDDLFAPQETLPQSTPLATAEPSVDDFIPDAVFREAKLFEKYCESDQNFRLYYNCECLAASFLDERIQQGPEAARTSIVQEIQDVCHDAQEAAAVQYNTCMSNALLLPKKLDSEAYCTCYGNRFATIFEEQQVRVTPGNITRVQTQSHSECRQRGEDMFNRQQ